MLSRSQAKAFFLGGTILACGTFGALTVHSFTQIPALTNSDAIDARVERGKHLWDQSNCMGCHTLLGEGGYYAPELTRVYERRGPDFIRAMLKDPEAMYPGQRRMQKYDLSDEDINALIAFFKWIGGMDLQGFPPKPLLFPMAVAGADSVVEQVDRPKIFNQMCIACHALSGQGGAIGPALDGIGSRMSMDQIEVWLDNPTKVRPGTKMPDLPLTEEHIRELAAYLSTLKGSPRGPQPASPAQSP
jgi:nitric oxide reductase subunit C